MKHYEKCFFAHLYYFIVLILKQEVVMTSYFYRRDKGFLLYLCVCVPSSLLKKDCLLNPKWCLQLRKRKKQILMIMKDYNSIIIIMMTSDEVFVYMNSSKTDQIGLVSDSWIKSNQIRSACDYEFQTIKTRLIATAKKCRYSRFFLGKRKHITMHYNKKNKNRYFHTKTFSFRDSRSFRFMSF